MEGRREEVRREEVWEERGGGGEREEMRREREREEVWEERGVGARLPEGEFPFSLGWEKNILKT